MKTKYIPDCWVIVKISNADKSKVNYRVLAGWGGGYLHGDSWKLSSGIVKVIDSGDHWDIHNTSGSIYVCGKNSERFTGLMANIFAGLADQIGVNATIEQSTIDECAARVIVTAGC